MAVAMFGVHPPLAPAAMALATLVAYARMYLGVHYPLDVAAGAAIGLITGAAIAVSPL
jgi:undecaprenyl-diphosphatase